MRKTVIALAAGAFIVLGTASTCQSPDPCLQLGAPTAQDLATVQAGRSVEQDVAHRGGTVECELVNGRWTRETES